MCAPCCQLNFSHIPHHYHYSQCLPHPQRHPRQGECRRRGSSERSKLTMHWQRIQYSQKQLTVARIFNYFFPQYKCILDNTLFTPLF